MKEILSLKSQRQLAIIELLMHNDWLTYPEASKQLNVPVKTLKSDLAELEALFEPIKIETSRNYGIKLKLEPSLCRINIYQKFHYNSLEFQIIEKVFFHEFSSIADLSDSLYISISTVKRIVRRINTALESEDFQINLKKMQVTGNPLSICNFMKRYFEEKYYVAENMLSNAQLLILDQTMAKIFEEHKPLTITFPCDFAMQNFLRIFSYTIIHIVKNNPELFTGKTPVREFKLLDDKVLCDEFYTQFSLSLQSDEMKNAITLFLNERHWSSIEEIHLEIQQSQVAKNKYQGIINLISQLEEKNNCICKNKEKVLVRIYNIENQVHGRNYILYPKKKDFYLGMRQMYGQPIQEIFATLETIFPSSNHKEYLIYEAFFILFTIWADLSEVIHHSVRSLKAGLLFDVEKDFVNILGKKIEYYLDHRFVCTTLQINSLDQMEQLSEEFDCIITNIPDISISQTPVVVCPLVLETRHFDKLLLIYEERYS